MIQEKISLIKKMCNFEILIINHTKSQSFKNQHRFKIRVATSNVIICECEFK